MKLNVKIQPMTRSESAEAVDLIKLSMNADEAAWAEKTFQYYFECLDNDIDSARTYYCALSNNGGDDVLCGLVGLHYYRWGPVENAWLSWFAVHPDYQGKGLGGFLINEIEKKAVESGYRKLFVETYNSAEFEKARNFYIKMGYSKPGEIEDYLPDNTAMIVFKKNL